MSTAPQHTAPSDDQLDGILRMLDARDKLSKITDIEISSLMLHCIWAKKVGWCSQEDFLLDEYMTRFERMAGISRDENGNITGHSAPRLKREHAEIFDLLTEALPWVEAHLDDPVNKPNAVRALSRRIRASMARIERGAE